MEYKKKPSQKCKHKQKNTEEKTGNPKYMVHKRRHPYPGKIKGIETKHCNWNSSWSDRSL